MIICLSCLTYPASLVFRAFLFDVVVVVISHEVFEAKFCKSATPKWLFFACSPPEYPIKPLFSHGIYKQFPFASALCFWSGALLCWVVHQAQSVMLKICFSLVEYSCGDSTKWNLRKRGDGREKDRYSNLKTWFTW